MKDAFDAIGLSITDVASQGNGVLGIRDSGKTYTATVLAERMFDAGVPFTAFDPIGVWRFLRVPGQGRGYPVVVAGGQDGDLPLTPASAPMIVEAAMANGVSLVIDLFDMHLSKADWRRIVRDCVRLMLHRNKEHGLRHVFLEEAAEFAPQRVIDGEVYAEIEKLARMGGNSRLGYTLINQRAEEVNKAVLELCDNLFLHRQKGKNSLNSLGKWLDLADIADHKAIIASLPMLPQGECWAWMAGSDEPRRIKVPAKNSLHPDRRVMRGDTEIATRSGVDVGSFVEALQKTLPSIEAATKASDPKALNAEIARLTRELAKAQRQVGAPPEPVKVIANQADIDAARAEGERIGIAIGISRAQQAVAALRVDAPMPSERSTSSIPRATRAARVPAKPIQSDGTVPTGCAKPLAALAAVYPSGLSEPQWATAAGYKRSGGTWGTYKSRLKAAGMIEQREGRFFATEAGATAVGDVELPPSPGPDLVRWWAARLPGTTRIAEALISAHPRALAREELAAMVDMSAAGGSFGTYLSRLAGADIIVREAGMIGLRNEVMA